MKLVDVKVNFLKCFVRLNNVGSGYLLVGIDVVNHVSSHSDKFKRKSEVVITFSFLYDTRWCHRLKSVNSNRRHDTMFDHLISEVV